MLTPGFEIRQSEDVVIIVIRAPLANVSETEIHIDECSFKFYSKPYYLRLTLPGELVEDGRETAHYDADTASFNIEVPKANPGEHFADLDLLTKLLAPTGNSSAKRPTIEVLDDEPTADECEENEDEEEFDWEIEQEPYDNLALSVDGPKYGFANQRCGVLKRLQHELHEVIDLKDADDVVASQRRERRVTDEAYHFSADHYWADMFDSDDIAGLLDYKPPWSKTSDVDANSGDFTTDEKEALLKLPRKEYLLNAADVQVALMSLVDILFAYAYDRRTTEGEGSAESGWTVAKLSATLSWLERFNTPRDVLIACYRRALCYPLYRHWQLTQQIQSDVQSLLQRGRRHVLKCLLDIRRVFIETGDQRYVLNDLYIDDYCTWIQHVRDKKLFSLAEVLSKMVVSKQDVGFDLNDLELAGRLALTRDPDDNDPDKLSFGSASSASCSSSDGTSSSDSSSSSAESDSDTESPTETESVESVRRRDDDISCRTVDNNRAGVELVEDCIKETDAVDVRHVPCVTDPESIHVGNDLSVAGDNNSDVLDRFVNLSVGDDEHR